MKIIPGILLCLILGAVIGFWIEELTYDPHPGYYTCNDCGPSFAQNLRWWRTGGK